MRKIYTTTISILLFCFLGHSQNATSIKEVSGQQGSPYLVPTNQTYTGCGYLQEDNALENGRPCDNQAPLVSSDDFVVPATECWNIDGISLPLFVPAAGPGQALSINLYIMSDNAGVPGTIIDSYNATPSEWTTTLKGSNHGLDVYTYDINMSTPFNMCGGATGTTFWFGVQVQAATGTFYWEFTTTQPYGNNGAYASTTAGPWTTVTDNFVFEFSGGNETYGTDVQSACQTYTWIDGNTYTSSNNTATHTLVNAAGCDSIVTLDLTINNSTTGTDVQSACQTYTWIDGNTYTASNNTATHTLTNAAGCDSIVTLDLTINSVDLTITNNSPTLAASANPATFQWVDCDDNYSPITGETSNEFTASSNGNYAVIVTQNGCTDTTICEIVGNIGLENNMLENQVSLYPNPTNGDVYLDASKNIDFVKVYSVTGQLIFESTVNDKNYFLNLKEEPNGIYMIQLGTPNEVITKRIVKH